MKKSGSRTERRKEGRKEEEVEGSVFLECKEGVY